MSALLDSFKQLSAYYDRNFFWEQIETLYENFKKVKHTAAAAQRQSSSDDEAPLAQTQTKLNQSACVTQLSIVRRALRDTNVISLLSEICSSLRNLRSETSTSYSNKYDNWEELIKISPRDEYLSFVYALAGLAMLDVKNVDYIKLSFTTISTYFLSLTIPGAKAFHIFDEDVIAHCLQIFTLSERMQHPEVLRAMSETHKSNVWCRLITLCDDIKVLLRFVHFNEYKNTRDVLLKRIIGIQYLNYERGFPNKSAATLHQYCYEIFDVMINEHNGDPEETLMKLLNMTALLHTFVDKPKGFAGSSANGCEHISDWFVKNIAKYPRLLTKVLTHYIECMVTNPIKTWKIEQIQRTLDYAAKYDAALYKLSNVSCVKFLCQALYSEEVSTRVRTIELMARILQIESHVDWQMFRHEVSDIPREVDIIKELIESMQDANNTIKVKAVQALHMALSKGSPNARKVLTEGIKFSEFNDTDVQMPDEPPIRKNEIRFSKPTALTPKTTFQGFDLIKDAFLDLPKFVYLHLFRNSQPYIRRAGIVFMEDIIKLNPLILFNTNFVEEASRLVDEPTAMVRKQLLLSVDAILACYPNCYPVIWVWCKIIAPMLRDGDVKNIDIAMECFRNRVLLNMRGFDNTNKPEHFMPWVIIRTLLCTQSRYYLQNCFHAAFKESMIKPETVRIIESHLHTTNSSEAWIVLNFITTKVKSKEPDMLLHAFMSMDSWNKETNMFIALEVLANCIKDFSHTALNLAFNHIQKHMREGTLLPVFVGKSFDFLLNIDNRNAQSRNAEAHGTDKEWLNELHTHLEQCLLLEMKEFPDNRSVFMSHLFSYSEVNLQTRLRPSSMIIDFVHKYLSGFMKKFDYNKELENERIFNAMIIIAARFSLRDVYVASRTCGLYAGILRKHDKPTIVNTLIVALTDICKKHTQCFERVMERVLAKLESPFPANRMETLKCFERLVLQEQLKLRGTLLVALLSAILDDCEKISERACHFFIEYQTKKDAKFFQQCLVDCPFVLNEYKHFNPATSVTDETVKSPLKGEAKRKKRQLLYNYMMLDMDEIFLVLYFGRLKLIADKSETDAQMKSDEGVGLVKDVLFILKRICQTTKQQKPTANGEQKDDESCDTLTELAELTEQTNAPTAAAHAMAGGGKGRRRREILTMPDALKVVEKSLVFIATIYENLHAYDKSLEKCFDELCVALVQRFPTYVDYAQPAQFWKKYTKSKIVTGAQSKHKKPEPTKTRQQKRKSARRICDDDDDSNNENDEDYAPDVETQRDNESTARPNASAELDYDTDDDLPLAAKKLNCPLPAKRQRKSYADISMEYLFNPNI